MDTILSNKRRNTWFRNDIINSVLLQRPKIVFQSDAKRLEHGDITKQKGTTNAVHEFVPFFILNITDLKLIMIYQPFTAVPLNTLLAVCNTASD